VSIESTDWQESGSGKMTPAQQRLLNSACGDLAAQVNWHGNRLSKDDFRHMVAAAVLGTRLMPAINTGEGGPGLIMLGRSSLNFTRSEATTAIRMAFDIGDNPQDQGLPAKPVRWCQTVVMARWIADESQTAQAA
jgi:hypothetical protein